MDALDFLGLNEAIQVMDVGAATIAEVPVYKSLLDANLARLNAFEGDARHTAEIKAAYGDKATVFTDFLFDGSEQTLYLASPQSGMTSLLKPREAALRFFNGFSQFGEVIGTETVQTKCLDQVEGIPKIDLLKMDIQGAELTVMKNGKNTLKSCLAAQLEVSYICLYEDQPSFGEIDLYMRKQGFVPHCFLDVKRWSIAPTIINQDFRHPGNQLLESDIVYVKDPLNLGKLTDLQLKKFAAIVHHCFKSADFVVHLLLELERRGTIAKESHLRYLSRLNG